MPVCLSTQYTMLGAVALHRASNTPNSTSLGTLLNAQRTSAPGTFSASASAPEVVWARTSSVYFVTVAEEDGGGARKYAAEHGIPEEEALKKGMEETSRESTEKGSELYAKA